MDQIPPLADFERWLVQLSVSGSVQELWRSSFGDQHANGRSSTKAFVLELVAELKQHLIQRFKADDHTWNAVLDSQRKWLSDETPETLQRYQACL